MPIESGHSDQRRPQDDEREWNFEQVQGKEGAGGNRKHQDILQRAPPHSYDRLNDDGNMAALSPKKTAVTAGRCW